MTLAQRLRDALVRSGGHAPTLLDGDPRDPLLDPDLPTTPAAVLIAVVDRPRPTVILTVRTDLVRHHAGQVAFPGGRIDARDASPAAAALREAEEEIGLSPHAVELVGITDRYRTITGFEVTPILGVVPAGVGLTPQPSEVAAIFEAPLDHLLDSEQQRVRTVDWRGSERSYYEIEWQGYRIWGATAAMIVNLSRRLGLAA